MTKAVTAGEIRMVNDDEEKWWPADQRYSLAIYFKTESKRQGGPVGWQQSWLQEAEDDADDKDNGRYNDEWSMVNW